MTEFESDVVSKKLKLDTTQTLSDLEDVSSEEIELVDTTAAIYVLDKALHDCAKNLKIFLTKWFVLNTCTDHHWAKHLGDTIGEISDNFKQCNEEKSATDTCIPYVAIRGYGYLERLVMEARNRDEGSGLRHDVIIILGHASVLLAEDKDLIAAFVKMDPTIIAFLGCCGGNTRYGPIATMSYLLPECCRPILAFYQRQVYIDELEHTSLMVGIQYYLRMRYGKEHHQINGPISKKKIALCAFGLAKSVISSLPMDPTVFINDRDGENLIQKLHDLKAEAVPLSCMQLVMYSPMVVDSKESWYLKTKAKEEILKKHWYKPVILPEHSCPEHELVIDDVLKQLYQEDMKLASEGIKIDELSKLCQEKIKQLQLHEIISLICEIKFIKLFEKTLELMRTGDKSSWEKIDPLQFLVAVLRGHWGKNSLTNIKTWATYHLKGVMKKAKSNVKILHQYQLCCICFVLLFEDSFLRFAKQDETYYQHEIIVCTKLSGEENTYTLYDITDTGYVSVKSVLPFHNLPDPGTFPTDDNPLSSWVDLLQHCEYKADCISLCNEKEHPKWAIGNRLGPKMQQGDQYSYKYEELLLAMGALSDGCQKILKETDKVTRQKLYNAKEFFDEDNEEKGYMAFFRDEPAHIDPSTSEEGSSKIREISYTESKLLIHAERKFWKKLDEDQVIKDLLRSYHNDPALSCIADEQTLRDAKSNSELNHEKVSSCRFVFAKFITSVNNVIKGILFYTDTHYGHNLIDFNKAHLDKLKKECTRRRKDKCFNQLPPALQIPSEQREGGILLDEDWIEGIKCLCGPCRYRMLKITIKEMEKTKTFPFIKVGRLTLRYNDDNTRLTKVELDECAELTATQHYS